MQHEIYGLKIEMSSFNKTFLHKDFCLTKTALFLVKSMLLHSHSVIFIKGNLEIRIFV